MQIYFPPSLRQFNPRRVAFSTWTDHVAFAYDLVEAIRPTRLVELGTYNGYSFFAFCQSMKEHEVDGVCYAVDTWEGDAHTGGYDETIYNDVQQHARQHYRGITYLLRMLFNEAVQHFEPESIDLLHIDGLHTYQAVEEDFGNWYPLVSPGGYILFHDIEARQADFGVWKFWRELERQHQTFAFHHGFGLGVLRKPGGERNDHQLCRLLFESTPLEQHRLRQLYAHASEFMEARRQAARLKQSARKGSAGKTPA